jgi:hypothetical protein
LNTLVVLNLKTDLVSAVVVADIRLISKFNLEASISKNAKKNFSSSLVGLRTFDRQLERLVLVAKLVLGLARPESAVAGPVDRRDEERAADHLQVAVHFRRQDAVQALRSLTPEPPATGVIKSRFPLALVERSSTLECTRRQLGNHLNFAININNS